MKNRKRNTSSYGFAIALASLLVIACSEQSFTTAARSLAPPSPRFVENSEHFYAGSDGYYYWDGQNPPGDESPADIITAEASGMAPRPGTGGWVAGKLIYIGDQSKIDIVYSVDSAGHSYWSNAWASSGWVYGWPGARTPTENYFSTSLRLIPMCDFSLEVGGTGYARKAIPFAVEVSLIKFSVALTFGSISWGEVSRPLQSYSNSGPLCDEDLSHSQCDNENTTEIEYCPVEGDPNNPPYPGAQASTPTDTRGDGGNSSPGGYVGTTAYCTEWIDWWVSFDGGHTWHYDYRQCKHYEYV